MRSPRAQTGLCGKRKAPNEKSKPIIMWVDSKYTDVMDASAAAEKFNAVAQSGEVSTTDLLDEIWAALPTVAVEDMLGAWRGGELPSGHPLDGSLEKARWYGKTFDSLTDVKPLVCRDEDGKLFSNKELGKGEASLWAVEFRGEVTASMVYDGQPVIDHFKRVDDHTVMGIMNGKTSLVRVHHYYFYLRRD